MTRISIEEVGSRVPSLRQRLAKDSKLLVTDDDTPVGVLFAPDAESLDQCMDALILARGKLAIERIQRGSVERGLDKWTMDDVNAFIAKVRQERDSR